MTEVRPEKPRFPAWLLPAILAGLSVAATAILAYGRLAALEEQIAELKADRLKVIEARLDRVYTDTMPEITELRMRCGSLERDVRRLEDRR